MFAKNNKRVQEYLRLAKQLERRGDSGKKINSGEHI
jgi:hypothetical protein